MHFLGFMGVNLAVIWKFWVHRADEGGRSFFVDVVLPALGFLFCTGIWVGLATPAKIAGCIWLVGWLLCRGQATRAGSGSPIVDVGSRFLRIAKRSFACA